MTYTQYSLQVTQILNLIYYICSSMVQEMYILALQISSLQSVDYKIYCVTKTIYSMFCESRQKRLPLFSHYLFVLKVVTAVVLVLYLEVLAQFV